MEYAYSPASKGLYRSDVNPQFPSDAREISQAVYLELIGKPITHDEDGYPRVADLVLSIEQLHQAKLAEINAACESAITGGFWSSALGTPYQYDSELEDQMNLTSAVLAGVSLTYPCRDAAGVKTFIEHSAEQIRQVGTDFTLMRQQLLQRANELKNELDTALAEQDREAIETVIWSEVAQ